MATESWELWGDPTSLLKYRYRDWTDEERRAWADSYFRGM